jgi:4-hydroxybenzoate polyprenyltransferase
MKEAIIFSVITLLIFVVISGIIIWPLSGFIVLVALLVSLGFYDLFQKKHTILRNFPVIGHMRYL